MVQKRVLISDPIEQVCVDILEAAGVHVDQKQKLSESELCVLIKDYDGLVVRSGTQVTAAVIEAAGKLKVVGRAGTGVDNIECDAASRAGVMVMNTPGGNTISAAEHTCALIMAMARNVAQGDGSMKEGKWERKNFMGVELHGKTLGVLGLGRVGREVVSRMQAFGMAVVGYDPMFPEEASRKLNIEPASAAECIRRADFLTIHVPLLDETRGLINEGSLATMKPGARIVNCARGGIIDEK
ncbi:D-isomer specific 2-hydroxyacid dehydrogenase, partial [Pavlovales sp. CCMP2436]